MGRRSHVIVIPYPAQGNVNPLMHLSQRIASLGFKVTFIHTDFNHKRVVSAMAEINGDPLGSTVNLVSIPDGMGPEGDRNDLGKLCEAILSTMPKKLEELIQNINKTNEGDDDAINCIIADGHVGWAREVAEKMGIKLAVVWPASAASFSLGANIPKLIDDGCINADGFSAKKQMIQLSPGIPTFDTGNFPWNLIGDSNAQRAIFKYIKRVVEESQLAEWQLCNSTYELEPDAFSLTEKLLPIGPLLSNYNTGTSGAQFWQEDSSCLEWLDQQPSRSVIYVAFGSFTVFDQTQFEELALGLQLTNKPFLWVARPGMTTQESIKECPGQLQSRNGRIVSWVPQQKVLSHPAITCFVSHCGWNSTMEGVSNGVPFLCWPYFGDQCLNKDYICGIWKVGLGFERDENGIIRKEEVKGKVERLLGDKSIRERSLKLKETIRDTIGEGGQSSTNFINFINWLGA
ncbi:UDP-glycosyltransferase 83A1 [Ricinus communis]|uniref:UDP-glucuronosyltransferase, putative n=1 Tax=Ricinus communis TaxID=3988 RepID=B9SJE8_RICCO|nr:UDP-glycosyltransferase 83A1 [Ricinus communis]EEF36311.1 UDP-glucuronosyltransferase, putative [Ricinus communis]|eukprot:XP_002526117.1 UDP-glycosyltransferase 83A1 [Ricinus communis]